MNIAYNFVGPLVFLSKRNTFYRSLLFPRRQRPLNSIFPKFKEMLSTKNVVVVEAWNTTTATQTPHRPSLLHPTFYWGYNCQVLFSGWPGSDRAMYALALIFVFLLAFLAEWITRCSDASSVKPGADKLAKVAFRTAMYAVKSGFSYLVILAVISFNGGIFLAAILGHAFGFAVFRGRACRNMGDRSDG